MNITLKLEIIWLKNRKTYFTFFSVESVGVINDYLLTRKNLTPKDNFFKIEKRYLNQKFRELNEVYYKHKCKYCGKPFNKKHNREMYCSKECRKYALREQKARYQAKRRLKIKRKELILRHNYKNLGSYGTCCKFHRRSKFEDEYRTIQREMQRIGLKKRR